MVKHFDRDLESIHSRVLTLFGVVEKMIADSIRALMEKQSDLANVVIATDDQVNHEEVRIEDECLKLLALHQPVASNLRRIATVMKINSDLERIADLACNVSERSLALAEYPYFPTPNLIPQMATDAVEMVREALNAYVDGDVETAKRVILADQRIDQANRIVIDELREMMISDSDLVKPALQCFSVSRHLERIGDHAENIAEDVIYMVSGDIIRHQHGFLAEETNKS